jgi:hypothetical protein
VRAPQKVAVSVATQGGLTDRSYIACRLAIATLKRWSGALVISVSADEECGGVRVVYLIYGRHA